MVFLSYRNRVMVANWWPHGQSIVTSHFRLYSPMNSSNLFSDQPHFSYTSHFTFLFFSSKAPALHSIPTDLFPPIPIKNIHSKLNILQTRNYYAINSSNYKATWYFKGETSSEIQLNNQLYSLPYSHPFISSTTTPTFLSPISTQ